MEGAHFSYYIYNLTIKIIPTTFSNHLTPAHSLIFLWVMWFKYTYFPPGIIHNVIVSRCLTNDTYDYFLLLVIYSMIYRCIILVIINIRVTFNICDDFGNKYHLPKPTNLLIWNNNVLFNYFQFFPKTLILSIILVLDN